MARRLPGLPAAQRGRTTAPAGVTATSGSEVATAGSAGVTTTRADAATTSGGAVASSEVGVAMNDADLATSAAEATTPRNTWGRTASATLRERRSWIFPALVALFVVMMGLLRISGSSVGMYERTLEGTRVADANLLFGSPRPVRSDEWRVATTMVVAQSAAGFPRVNPNIGLGEDMSVVFDLPYWDWSVLLRPQNWPFFVLPLEVAFALKWWFLGGALAVALYFLLLRLLPGKYLVSAFLALGFAWAPFMQWWYQAGTQLAVAYACFALLSLFRLAEARIGWARAGWTVLAAYLMACFAFFLYPPFQILVAEVVVVLYLGYLLERHGRRWRDWWRAAWPAAAATALAGLVVLAYIETRLGVIRAVTGSVYPGHRFVPSGGYQASRLLSGVVSYALQDPVAAGHYDQNQSEGSNFLFVWPFLLLPSLYALWRQWRRQRHLDWSLLLANLLLGFMCLPEFVRLPRAVTQALGFGGILHSRVLLGLGLTGLFQLALVARAGLRHNYPRWLTGSMAAATVVAVAWAGLDLVRQHPGLVRHRAELLLVAAGLALAVGLWLWGRLALGAGVVFAITLASSFHVHPLYHGLAPLTSGRLADAIRADERARPGPWIVVDLPNYANYPQAVGVPAYSGAYSYPQLELWKQFDPTGRQQAVYNRYGYAMFDTVPRPRLIKLEAADSFSLWFDSCDPRMKSIKHVMSSHPLNQACVQLDRLVSYPSYTLYLYHTR